MTHTRHLFAALALVVVAMSPAVAQNKLLINTRNPYTDPNGGLYINAGPGSGGPSSYGYVNITTLLYNDFGSPNVTQQFSADITASALSFDRLWIDFRTSPNVLGSDEQAVLAGFIASGKRVVFIGENYGYTAWNQSFLDIVGGGPVTPLCSFETTATALDHELTAGVNFTRPACASEAAGGSPLFEFNYATLWGPQQNVLTVLDSDVFDDNYGSFADNPRFASNVAQWLSEDVPAVLATPEPESTVLMASGLATLALLAGLRRRAYQATPPPTSKSR